MERRGSEIQSKERRRRRETRTGGMREGGNRNKQGQGKFEKEKPRIKSVKEPLNQDTQYTPAWRWQIVRQD